MKICPDKKYSRVTAVITTLSIIMVITISTFSVITPVYGSKLDDFETAATKDDSQKDSGGQKQKDKDEDTVGDFFDGFRFVMVIVGNIIYYTYEGTKMSYARVGGQTDIDPAKVEIRQTGEPTLPFFEADYKYIHVNSEINANDVGIELGDGPLGIDCRSTLFTEKNPKDNLTLTAYHVLLRMSPNHSQEYGIGAGTLYICGNEQNSGFSLTFPIKFYLNRSIGIRFKPTYSWINGNLIRDNDLSFVLTKRFNSVELGHRSLETNGENLSGSYIGFAWHY